MIRHGEIPANVKKIYVGLTEEELTGRGEAQVRLLAGNLKGRGIRILYSSPLRRALQTAAILAHRLELPIVREENLREIALGPLEGLSYEQIIAQMPEVWRMWNETPAEVRLPGMEPLGEVQTRILSVLKKLAQKHKDEIIGVVTHLAVMRCALLASRGKSLNEYRAITIPNATALVFETTVHHSDDELKLKLMEEIQIEQAI